eukprot:3813037-Amphidinium_carterae.1
MLQNALPTMVKPGSSVCRSEDLKGKVDVVDVEAELFPSPYIHLGGDEVVHSGISARASVWSVVEQVATEQWNASSRAHNFLVTQGMKELQLLQSSRACSLNKSGVLNPTTVQKK